jgi:hypothetical protein
MKAFQHLTFYRGKSPGPSRTFSLLTLKEPHNPKKIQAQTVFQGYLIHCQMTQWHPEN